MIEVVSLPLKAELFALVSLPSGYGGAHVLVVCEGQPGMDMIWPEQEKAAVPAKALMIESDGIEQGGADLWIS